MFTNAAIDWTGIILGWRGGVEDKRPKRAKERDQMANAKEAVEAATAITMAAYREFEAARDKLAGTLRNDIASVSASAEKMTASMAKVSKAVGDVQRALNGAEMQHAIANAERLAAALGAINAIHSHKITLAVIDNKPEAP